MLAFSIQNSCVVMEPWTTSLVTWADPCEVPLSVCVCVCVCACACTFINGCKCDCADGACGFARISLPAANAINQHRRRCAVLFAFLWFVLRHFLRLLPTNDNAIHMWVGVMLMHALQSCTGRCSDLWTHVTAHAHRHHCAFGIQRWPTNV